MTTWSDWFTRKSSAWPFVVAWYLLALIVLLSAYRWLDWDTSHGWSRILLNIVVLALFAMVFVIIHRGLAVIQSPVSERRTLPAAPGEIREAFPSPATMLVFAWLVVFALASIVGVLFAAWPSLFPRLDQLLQLSAQAESGEFFLQEALVTMLAAAVGAAITTLLGYLQHASTDKDFDPAFVPWYVARPIMGILLGLVFYFLIRGGLLLTVDSANYKDLEALNLAGLAGIGALVGLFSKNAIEKLREVFNTAFRTASELRDQLSTLSNSVREKLMELLPPSVTQLLMFGSPAELEAALKTLPEDTKKKLRDDLPEPALKILEPLLGANILQQLRALPDDEIDAFEAAIVGYEDIKRAYQRNDLSRFQAALDGLAQADRKTLEAQLTDRAKKILASILGGTSSAGP